MQVSQPIEVSRQLIDEGYLLDVRPATTPEPRPA